MKDNEITITITARPGAGKSAIAQQIAGHLQSLDFPVSLEFINNEHPPRDAERHLDIMNELRKRETTIYVKESIKPRTAK